MVSTYGGSRIHSAQAIAVAECPSWKHFDRSNSDYCTGWGVFKWGPSHVWSTPGVCPGSPVLFLLYINDLPENIQSQIRLFADDWAVYLTVSNLHDSQVLHSDLESLQRWERTWDMQFNPGLRITWSKNPVMFSYFVHNQKLESLGAAKYLSVSISKDLSWKTHINNITACANRTLGFVKRNVLTKNEEIKTMAYSTLVSPQLEYASAVWGPFTKENIGIITKVQRRAARWVSNVYSTYSGMTDMLNNLGCTLDPTDKFIHQSVTTSIHFSPMSGCSLEQATSWSRPGFWSWLLQKRGQ